MKRRLLFSLLVAGILTAPASYAAEPYPNKPIKLVVPFVVGGSADLLGRIVGQKLSEKYGQPVVIENRAGASGLIGAEAVSKSPADGYTLVLGTTGVHAAYSMYSKLRFDPATTLVPVSIIGEFPNVLVVHPSVPAKNVKEFLALAKSQPDSLFFGSAGNGSSTHLAGELFKSMTGASIKHVPYRGSGAALTDLVGGQIQVMFENLPTILPFIQSGQVRALGVTSKERSVSLPNVPTVAEAGVPGYEFGAWFTIAAPVGTPPEVLKKLNHDIDAIVHAPDLSAKWKELGVLPVGGKPEAVASFVGSEKTKWGRLVSEANLHAD